MLDKIFAFVSMSGVVLFMGIVAWNVREPDLLILIFLVLWIGILFIWRDVRSDRSYVGDKARGADL